MSVKAGSFDFEITKFECSASTIPTSNFICITAAQMLHGDSIPTDPCLLQFYLSTDTIVDDSDVEFCKDESGSFDVFACYWFEHAWEGALIQFKYDFELPTPSDLTIEDYYVIAVTDYNDQHAETNENNNIRFAPIKIKGSATNDIYISNVSVDNAILNPQQKFSFTFDIHYRGDSEVDLNPILNLMYSRDTIWGNDAEDILVYPNPWSGSTLSKSNPVDHVNWWINLKAGLRGDYYLLIKTDWNDRYKEDDETNNYAYIKIFVEEEVNDFWIKKVSCFEEELQPGQHSTVSTRARYNGNNHSEIETTIKQYLSKDTIWDQSDVLICAEWYCREATFNDAKPELEVYSSIELPLDLAPGDYYIISTIEPPTSIIETDTTNNANYCKVKISGPATHDFYPSDFELSSNSMYSGSQFNISCTLNYGGNTHLSVQSKLKVYFSPDSIWDDQDIQISKEQDYENYGFNVDKRTEQIRLYMNLPNNLQNGEYYILVVADPENIVEETNENNNTVYSKITVEEVIQDFIVDWVKTEEKTFYAGGIIQATSNLRNINNSMDASTANVALYLSTDTILHNEQIDSSALEEHNIQFYSWEREQTGYHTIFSTDGIAPGKYFLILSIDDRNQIDETNELNNSAYTEIVIEEAPTHDFGIENISISNDTLKPKENVTVSFDQVYYGNNKEEMNSQYGIYFSADTIIDYTDYGACSNGCGSYGYSVSNPRQQCGRNLTIPASTQPGNYYFLIVVDYANQYDETNEANNTVIVPVIVEEIYRDYFIDSLTIVPSSVPSFDYATVKIYCGSTGNEAANNSVKINLRLSKNDVWGDSDDYSFCTDYYCPSIYIGGTQKHQSAEHMIFIPKEYGKGDYFLFANIDGNYQYDETDESNNIISKAFKITGPALRDFYITDMVISDTIVHSSAPVTLTYKHHYEGNSTQYLTEHIGLYVSNDTILNTGDREIKNGTEPFDVSGGNIANQIKNEHNVFTLPSQMELGNQYLILKADCDNQHEETNEENNTAYVKINVIDEEVDLSISQFKTEHDTIQAGGRIRATIVGNLTGNTLNALNPRCQLFLSNDTIVSNDDRGIGNNYFYLNKNQVQKSIIIDADIPVSVNTGNKYLLVKIDDTNSYKETNEANNVLVYPIVVAPEPFHDFYICSAEPSDSKLQPLTSFQLNFKYCYGGNSIDDVLSYMHLYLSKDSVFEPNTAIDLNRDPYFRLNVNNDQKNHSFNFTIPEGTKAGEYYLLLVADSKNQVNETNEANNVYKIKVEVEDLYYEFSINSVDLTPDSLQKGGGINVSYQINKYSNVKNDIQLRCGIYISNDSIWGYDDVQLDYYNYYIPATDNAYKVVDRYIKLPDYYEIGSYFLLLKADDNNKYDEESESNNITAVQLNVVERATCDFFIEDVTIQTVDIQPDTYFSVNLKHRYQGNSNDDLSTNIQFRLSVDSLWDNSDDIIIGTYNSVKHSINQPTVNIDRSFKIPATTTPGYYNLLVKTDNNDAHTETNEANNIFSTLIEIEEVISDFKMQNLHLSYDSVQAGGFLTASYDMVYKGNSINNIYTYKTIVVSTDSILGNDDDLNLAKTNNGSFRMNRNDTINSYSDKVSFPIDLTPGTYYIIVMADAKTNTVETDETNNIAIIPFTVLPEAAHDFYLSDFSSSIDTLQAHLQIPFEIVHDYSGNSISDVSAPISIFISFDSILGNNDDVPVYYYSNTDINLNRATTTGIETGSFTIEDESLIGNNYLLIEIDPENEFNETDETNNILCIPVFIEEIVNDLFVGNIEVDPIQIQQQGLINITYTINYQGNNKSFLRANPQMLLSTDTIWNENTDVVICNNCGNFNFSKDVNEITKIQYFNNTGELATGEYYILVKIDYNDRVDEINEDNNISFKKIEIIDKATRDFTISDLLVYKEPIYPNSLINISYKFNYEGNSVDHLLAYSRCVLSVNEIWGDEDDIEIYNSDKSSNFNKDKLSQECILKNLRIPDNIQPGKYQLLVKADCNDIHAETNEANNISVFHIEVLDNEQDISIKNLSVDTDTVYAGNTVNLSGSTATRTSATT